MSNDGSVSTRHASGATDVYTTNVNDVNKLFNKTKFRSYTICDRIIATKRQNVPPKLNLLLHWQCFNVRRGRWSRWWSDNMPTTIQVFDIAPHIQSSIVNGSVKHDWSTCVGVFSSNQQIPHVPIVNFFQIFSICLFFTHTLVSEKIHHQTGTTVNQSFASYTQCCQ